METIGIGVTFFPNNRDLTFNTLLHKLKDYGDDITGSDQPSVNERQSLDRQLTAIYNAWNNDLVNRKVSPQEELATYVLGFVKHRFLDDEGRHYAVISVDGHHETHVMDSEDFKKFVARVAEQYMTDTLEKVISDSKRDLAIRHLKDNTTERRTLYNRVAFIDDEKEPAIYIDLHNKQWQAIKITKNGWAVVENPLLFRRHLNDPKKYSMPIPKRDYDKTRSYIRELLDSTTIQYLHQKVIVECYTISLYLNHIAHPMMVPYGPKGSGKSSVLRFIKQIVDPVNEYEGLLKKLPNVKDDKERFLGIFNNYLTFYDNVSMLSYDEMDEFCTVVTGISKTLRILYTTDETREYSFKRPLGLNGINIPISRGDILDRSFVVELKARREQFLQGKEDGNGKKIIIQDENELFLYVKKLSPEILGYVSDVLVKTLVLYESERETVQKGHRMAGFVLWCELIARALDYPKDFFMTAWEMNVETQKLAAISNNSFADLLVQYAYRYHVNLKTIEKEPAEMLKELRIFSESIGLDYHNDKGMPKNTVWLSRQIKELETDLEVAGLTVDFGHAKTRSITLVKDDALFKHYDETTKRRQEADKQIAQDKLKQIEETRKENALRSFGAYCENYSVTVVPPLTFQQHLLIHGFKDTGTAKYTIDKLVEEGKLKIDSEGNLAKP